MKHFFVIIGILSFFIFQSCEEENGNEESEDNIEQIFSQEFRVVGKTRGIGGQ